MLKEVRAASIGELFEDISPSLRSGPLKIPPGMSEFELVDRLKKISEKNSLPKLKFAGGGFYRHIIPSAVDYISSMGGFYTPYTPYQSECSQGTLQAMFEYQSASARLASMEVSNASLYDGGSAMSEAALMALRITGRSKVIMCGCINPLYRDIARTYLKNTGASIVELSPENYGFNYSEFKKEINEDTACLIYQNPNFFGTIEDYTEIASLAREKGALAVAGFYPVSLGMLRPPGECGADIAFSEGQSLGIPLSGGGPYLGMLTTRKKYIRSLPGRIAGFTRGKKGGEGYVLTLQAREQHIRRHRATSNICTNQSLCALRALVFLCLLGKEGLTQMAEKNYDGARGAAEILSGLEGVEVLNSKKFFNEFVLKIPRSASWVCEILVRRGIEAGIPLGQYYEGMENMLLVAVTETARKKDVEDFASELQTALKAGGKK